MAGLADLRFRHRGPVIAPDDGGYETARGTFNGMLDRRPELVTRPLDVEDVAAAVGYALEAGLPVAVRGGGHGVAGHCVGDDSLVVDLRLMRHVAVSPEERTVTCGGGALWEDVDPACQRHGLAMPGGTFSDTGVAGLTLGGGIGFLTPAFGLTLDNLLSARLVTADGEIITASEQRDRSCSGHCAAAAGTSASLSSSRSGCIRSACCLEARSSSRSRTPRPCSARGGT